MDQAGDHGPGDERRLQGTPAAAHYTDAQSVGGAGSPARHHESGAAFQERSSYVAAQAAPDGGPLPPVWWENADVPDHQQVWAHAAGPRHSGSYQNARPPGDAEPPRGVPGTHYAQAPYGVPREEAPLHSPQISQPDLGGTPLPFPHPPPPQQVGYVYAIPPGGPHQWAQTPHPPAANPPQNPMPARVAERGKPKKGASWWCKACCGCCCLLLVLLIAAIVICVKSLRAPEVSTEGVQGPSDGTAPFTMNGLSFEFNFGLRVRIKNPNIIGASFDQVEGDAVFKDVSSSKVGSGKLDNVAVPRNSDQLIVFPVTVAYDPANDPGSKIILYVASSCGLLGGQKTALQIEYSIRIHMFPLKTFGIIPSTSGSTSIDCPIPDGQTLPNLAAVSGLARSARSFDGADDTVMRTNTGVTAGSGVPAKSRRSQDDAPVSGPYGRSPPRNARAKRDEL